jgi:hypothetical protein
MSSDRLCGLVVRVPGYGSRHPAFYSRRYQIFWVVVVLELGPSSLMSITELVEWKSSGSGSINSRLTACGDPLLWPRDTLHPQKLALISPTCSGRSVGIVRLRTKATEFSFLVITVCIYYSIYIQQGISENTEYHFLFSHSLRFLFFLQVMWKTLVAVAERSEEWTVFDRSEAAIAGSHPALGMDV